ncbi:ribonuclease Oy-like [Cotesia typhae]|uniref:ribonuclease Oy-like n=1 Tax=Cotesia typhae TaxID=2053667 RepID=UPI003D684D3D
MNFDTLVLSLSWPPTVCYKHLKKNRRASCKFPIKNEWSIHGLWPSRIARRAPDFCNCTRKYNPAEIETIMPELEKKWINVLNYSDSNFLWNHEWSKHGTCASAVESLNTQFKYFNQTLKLFDEYNISLILSENEIELEGTYKQTEILEAFEKSLGKQIGINCIVHFESDRVRKYFLGLIHLCFDKAFNLIDCIKNKHYPSNCPSVLSISGEVEYSAMEEILHLI